MCLMSKNTPKISFGGAYGFVLNLMHLDDNLVFLRLIGEDTMLRSISAAIMQGRMKIKENYLNFPSQAGYVQLHKEGMRRIINPLRDGISECIVYYREFLPTDNDMSLLWHDKYNCAFTSFKKYLQLQPIPRIKSLENGDKLEKDIFQIFVNMEIIKKLDSPIGDKKASFIKKLEIENNDYELLRNTIIDVLSQNLYKINVA